jgi:hypothetical protein
MAVLYGWRTGQSNPAQFQFLLLSLKVHKLTNLINYSSFWTSPSSQWLDSIPVSGRTVRIRQEPVPVPAKPFANGRNLYGRTRYGGQWTRTKLPRISRPPAKNVATSGTKCSTLGG